MRLKSGRGYVSADRNNDEDLPVGYIPIDSVHSPVRKVNFSVEAARLGQMTDYDKLTIEVWTNGAISPADAIGQAAKLLKDHMAIFINFEELPESAEEPAERALSQMNEVLNRSVEELELSVRSYNCLKNANIQTIGDLVQKTEAEMLRTKNFGRKSLNEIKEILAGLGLTFGMKFDAQGRLVSPSGTPAVIGADSRGVSTTSRRRRIDDEEEERSASWGIAASLISCDTSRSGYKLKRDCGSRKSLFKRAGHQRHRARAHRHHRSQGQGRQAAGGQNDHAGQARYAARAPSGRGVSRNSGVGEEAVRQAGHAVRPANGRLHARRAARLAQGRRRGAGHVGTGRFGARQARRGTREAP